MSPNWKPSLSAIDRYENIQNIVTNRGIPIVEATTVEKTAYEASSSLTEYTSIINTTAPPPTNSPPIPEDGRAEPEKDYGITIGTYKNCTPLASGLTSQVYRSATTALKIITNYAEPHNPQREARILDLLRNTPSVVELLDVFRDQESHMVLAFPYMSLTLADLPAKNPTGAQIRAVFKDVFRGLENLHSQGIIHRDIKPSAILLPSPSGPAVLSDFGTAWHPSLSTSTEPADSKVLDIGTSIYRAPEVLFGNKVYGSGVDMWAAGVMLAECLGKEIFDSRPTNEDGNQLGLILSIFKTLGTPNEETWPEAKEFKVKPFELWTVFEGKKWEDILPDIDPDFRELVAALVRYDKKRATAEQALQFNCLTYTEI